MVTFALNFKLTNFVFSQFGFIPANFSGINSFEPIALITPISHMFLHGGWLHIGMNCIMLLAFGSGVERWLGGKAMLIILLFSGVAGAFIHFILNIESVFPVVGASGGLSGLFAAALIMMNQGGAQTGRYGIWPFIVLWVGISVVLGSMGSPDGNEVAWAAHVGGFLGGFVILKLLRAF